MRSLVRHVAGHLRLLSSEVKLRQQGRQRIADFLAPFYCAEMRPQPLGAEAPTTNIANCRESADLV